MTRRILLLAGTAEARAIAGGLAELGGVCAMASMAGATRAPQPLALPCRIGGFGGEAGFRAYLDTHRIDAVIDATHPFATRVSARTAWVCRDTSRAHLRVLRPEWRPAQGDDWTMIADESEAADHIPHGATVFVGTGRQTIDRLGNLSGRYLHARVMDPPDAPFPFPDGEYLVSRPPFSVPGEVALFRRLGIDWLLVKNSGGAASRPKLDAARDLGLPVAMIARPRPPDAEIVTDADAALTWAQALT